LGMEMYDVAVEVCPLHEPVRLRFEPEALVPLRQPPVLELLELRQYRLVSSRDLLGQGRGLQIHLGSLVET